MLLNDKTEKDVLLLTYIGLETITNFKISSTQTKWDKQISKFPPPKQDGMGLALDISCVQMA